MSETSQLTFETFEARDTPNLTRAERRDQQTQRILEAAKVCFVRYGFQGASMQQICTEAGMSPGALYRYFPSKEAIVEAICEADRREDAELFARVLRKPDVVEGLVFGAMAHIRHMHENDAAVLFAEISAEAMRNPAVEATCMKNMQEVHGMFSKYIGDAQVRGEIDPPVELDVLLPALMAVAHGMALKTCCRLECRSKSSETILRAIVVGMLRPAPPPRPELIRIEPFPFEHQDDPLPSVPYKFAAALLAAAAIPSPLCPPSPPTPRR